MGESIGMMEGAYFVGRVELLRWINSLTGLGYTKIEQTASGVVACHVFDALFPGKVKLEKVNFDARRDYEFVHNYKVLQAAFKRLNITKEIFVDKLIRAKYQDNLEFMQWLKGYYDQHANDAALNYDGRARRESIGRIDRPAPARAEPKTTAASRARTTSAAARRREPIPPPPRARRVAPGAAAAKRGVPRPADTVKKSEYDSLKKECEDLALLVQEGDQEREFYFQKLQQIESILQDLDDKYKGEELDPLLVEVASLIKDVLYEQDPREQGEEGAEPFEGEHQEGELTEEMEPAAEVLRPEEQGDLAVGQLSLEDQEGEAY